MTHPLNLSDPAFYRDRRASYRHLRTQHPVALTVLNGEPAAVITRFKDAEALLRDPRSGVQPAAGEFPAHLGDGAAAAYYRLSAPAVDDPEHTRLRRVLNESFSPPAVRQMELWVAEIVERHVDKTHDQQVIDFIPQIALAIPIEVVCRLMDMPQQDAPALLARMADLTPVFSQAEMDRDTRDRADQAASFYFNYFGRHLDGSAGLSDESFTRALVRAEGNGQFRREDSLSAMMNVFIGGIHTTMTALSNAVSALGLHPAQRSMVAADGSLIARAWDEVLRYQPPVHFRHRYLTEPIELHGVRIETRVKVMICLASANWDETEIEDPDTFNALRTNPRHLAFGGGRHFCLGMQLARLEGRLFLQRFLSRYPDFQVVDLPSPRVEDLTFPHFSRLSIELGRQH